MPETVPEVVLAYSGGLDTSIIRKRLSRPSGGRHPATAGDADQIFWKLQRAPPAALPQQPVLLQSLTRWSQVWLQAVEFR